MSDTPEEVDPPIMYDIIIVGGGIAGLYTAVELLRRAPDLKLGLFEKYEGVGGRCYTFKKEVDGVQVQWEAGAGRISKSHRRLLGLFQRYKLHLVPIGSDVLFKEDWKAPLEPNAFEPSIPAVLDPLAGLPAEDLGRQTIKQLLTKVRGAAFTENLLARYPYRVETETMRADLALKAFREEMRSQEGYGICAEGLSALAKALRKDIERRGGEILSNHELVGGPKAIGSKRAPNYELEFLEGPLKDGPQRQRVVARAERIILAIPSAALAELDVFRDWTPLKYLKMTPLLRFYGVFPLEPNGKPWWSAEDAGGGNKLVTPEAIRYFIPGDPKKGTCHISYTDSQDAEHWMRSLETKGEKRVGEEMVAELRRLLRPSIPPPKFVKAHAWKEGVTNWLPGPYDPVEWSRRALNPFPDTMPGVHICGESFSLRQGWIEGALEHADHLLGLLGRSSRLRKTSGKGR